MASKDLRFFDSDADVLPDGCARRGMSVVAALSTWLEHTNHRIDGAWTQRYEHGVPVGALLPVTGSAHTGTTVRFRPDEELVAAQRVDPSWYAGFPWLTVNTASG
jgi:DNA gyrase subunit B